MTEIPAASSFSQKAPTRLDPAAKAFDLAAGNRGHQHIGAKLDPVGHHRMGRAAQRGDAFDGDGRGALALDLGAHAAQAVDKIDNFGLARCVLQDRGALASVAAISEILGGPHACETHLVHSAFQAALRPGVQIAVTQFDLGPERRERVDMDIHRPRADGAAAGQRDHGMAKPRQQRPQHQIGGPHLAHDVVIRDRVQHAMRGHGDDLALLQGRNLDPKALQQLRHGADV
ncbi:hypothetical protein MASR1M32_15390 [Rhodobacter sp.]